MSFFPCLEPMQRSNADKHYMANGLTLWLTMQPCRTASVAVEVQGMQAFAILAQFPWVHSPPHKGKGLPCQWSKLCELSDR